MIVKLRIETIIIEPRINASLILICSEFWTQFSQKQTNLSSNVVPIRLDFSNANGHSHGCYAHYLIS